MKKIKLLLVSIFCFYSFSQGQGLNMSLEGSLNYPGVDGSDIWGYYDDSTGKEYGLIGLEDRFAVVDITDPTNPTEVFHILGVSTIWRDIKTWGHYAYIIHDSPNNPNDPSEGLLIVDLSDMTGNTYSYYEEFGSAHNIYIDENGVAYIFGADQLNGGAMILSLANPTDPSWEGTYDNRYLHDGMVRGDTLWGGAVYDGVFVAVDVSDINNIVEIGVRSTPDNFTHNIWVSEDGKTVFTTDETGGAYLTSYDVSDLSNITELDRFQPSPGSNSIPHNTHVMGNLVYTSWYTEGIRIVDASDPSNLIEVAYYETYSGSGGGFNGCWGAYPFSPNGLVLTSEINSGPNGEAQLLVFSTDLSIPCSFEALVIDSSSNLPVTGAVIQVLETSEEYVTDNNGETSFGFPDQGTYTLVISSVAHLPDTITVTCESGANTEITMGLYPLPTIDVSGIVTDINTSMPIGNAQVHLYNDDFSFETTSDVQGNFSIDGITEANYSIVVGTWGYITQCKEDIIETSNHNFVMETGFYDDFSLDFGWTVSGDAPRGIWERGEPQGTFTGQGNEINPDEDVEGDCSDMAFITGNGGGNAGNDDVDSFSTVLHSPIMDLSLYQNPHLFFHTWFQARGAQSAVDDSMVVYLSDGTTMMEVLNYNPQNLPTPNWVPHMIRLRDFMVPGPHVQLIVTVADWESGNQSLVEGGLDLFRVVDSMYVGRDEMDVLQQTKIFPNPSSHYLNISSKVLVKDFEIWNSGGQLVASKNQINSNSHQIDIRNLPSGIYFIELKSNEITSHRKFIISR